MIIDAHTHIGRNEHINSTASQLIVSMDAAGIDKSLVFAGGINNCPNDYLLDQIAPYQDRLYGVAFFRRWDGQGLCVPKQEIDHLAHLYEQKKIVAVKFYTGYDHYYPADVNWELSLLEEVGCPVIFHSGDCLSSIKRAKLKYSHPLHIDEVAVDHPKMNFIIAHIGFPFVREAAEVCYKNDNVYTDISGFVYGDFDQQNKVKFSKVLNEFLEIAPAHKLLFGTDYPISNQKSYVWAVGDEWDIQGMTPNTQRAFKFIL
jgi:uncharacterized protein